jgi:hypothetical protein
VSLISNLSVKQHWAHPEAIIPRLSIKALIRSCRMTNDIAQTNTRITISAAWAPGNLCPSAAATRIEICTRTVNANAFNSSTKAKVDSTQTVRMTDIIPDVSVKPKNDSKNTVMDMATNHAALFTWNTDRPSIAFMSIIIKSIHTKKNPPPEKIEAT